jgi:hypothetical protein
LLDHALGATQGMIVYRGAANWTALAPGASGAVLTSGGSAANPSWVTGSGAGTVTQVNTSTGLIGGPITGTGTISFATVANQTLLANISGATAAPTPSGLSAIIDAVFGATRGSVLYRGASGWAALGPGTAGQALTTGGAGADPTWAAGGGTSITIGDTPPSTPSVGAGWWDSVSGQLYLWFNDGTSAQWVPASNQPGPAGPTGATGAAGSANMSGMVAGQIPIAASATSVTSSTSAITVSAGLRVGAAPTGGDMGAGTVNVAGSYYVNGQNITGGHLPGTQTNDNAAAGQVGEYIAWTVLSASAVSLSNAVPANVASMALTAGDWDVSGYISFTAGTTSNVTVAQAWCSTTSATAPDQALRWQDNAPAGGLGGVFSADLPVLRVSIAGPATVYLSCNALFASSTCTACGTISARRAR